MAEQIFGKRAGNPASCNMHCMFQVAHHCAGFVKFARIQICQRLAQVLHHRFGKAVDQMRVRRALAPAIVPGDRV